MNDYLLGLARMADQIAGNFESRSPEEAARGVAEHLRRFWAPSMRRDLAEAVASGVVEVSAAVRGAIGSAQAD